MEANGRESHTELTQSECGGRDAQGAEITIQKDGKRFLEKVQPQISDG